MKNQLRLSSSSLQANKDATLWSIKCNTKLLSIVRDCLSTATIEFLNEKEAVLRVDSNEFVLSFAESDPTVKLFFIFYFYV
jgi:hypothetical protein